MRPEFAFNALSADGIAKAISIAILFNDVLSDLSVLCPQETREFSIVKTKLEEACFFAKKAMASDPCNQLANPIADKAAA